VLGSNSSACPSGFFPLDYEKACRRAAEQAVPNKPYGGSLSGDDLKAAYMAGCYWHTVDGSVYFNDKPASAPGSVDSFALQLCAGAPIPARRYAPHASECGARQSFKGCALGLRVRCVPCMLALLRVRLLASERAYMHASRPAYDPSIHPIHSPIDALTQPSTSV
jgi:hypothetical protein